MIKAEVKEFRNRFGILSIIYTLGLIALFGLWGLLNKFYTENNINKPEWTVNMEAAGCEVGTNAFQAKSLSGLAQIFVVPGMYLGLYV